MIRTHKISEVSAALIGELVTLGGWVNSIRRLGKLSFVELRDSSGLIQLSFISDVAGPELMQLVEKLGPEAVMSATGIVRARPRKRNGESDESVEIEVTAAEVFNQPEALPFPVANDTPVPAKLKIEHRTLYLRRERLHRNLVLRSKIFQFVRNWFVERGFNEVDTPVLFKTTIGGAREFIVPTRSHPGQFYVLRQSPQQLKQMLMASGVDKYFQICKLFHDTNIRSRRQREFTAIDLEVAFATETDIIALVQDLMTGLVGAAGLDFVVSKPFPKIPHFECLKRFGAEEADLRFAIEAGKLSDESYLVRIPYRLVPLYEKDLLLQFAKEGITIVSRSRVGSTEQDNLDWQTKLTETREGDLILLLQGQEEIINAAVETSRSWLNDHLDPLPWKHELTFFWTECPPLFKQDFASGRWKIRHQAFTAPVDPSQLERVEPDFAAALGREYVLSCNGAPLGSGSARIISPTLQRRIFQLDGMSDAEIDFFFGPLLRALASGAPPHAGITLSLDALIRLLAGEEDLSEIIAFPKLGTGIDPLTGAPNTLPDELLKEFGIARLT